MREKKKSFSVHDMTNLEIENNVDQGQSAQLHGGIFPGSDRR